MRSALLGPGSHQHLARALEPAGAFELGERVGYLRPGRLPTGLVQAGEHLVQRAERLPLEPDTVGRRGQPQRPGEDVTWAEEIRRQLAELYLRALEAYALAALGLGGPELATAEHAGRELVTTAPSTNAATDW
jgi:hypothetical protein